MSKARDELWENITALIGRAKGYGYPLTTEKAASDIIELVFRAH